ncbi:hypothetical protein C8F04DRAFT_1137404 [Mycena alexandri]|uniref:Uncharacterized protein n=1 Tax=Mycena alexandri TaxID=1745969 RepID=A0AAD6WRL1_9AGAR|nr:hypothetical protein C8F04DRAFT_1137404 [Mycena alexandri]
MINRTAQIASCIYPLLRLCPHSHCPYFCNMSPPWTNLAGLAIGGPLYGVYFVLYILSTYLLLQRSSGTHASPVYRSTIFVSGLFLFVAVTGNFVLTVVRAFLGFIVVENGTAAAAFFNDNSQITTTVQNVCAALAILISDSVIIYRLWIVWSRNKYVIILPILTLFGLMVALVLSVQTTTHVNSIAEDKGLTPGLIFTLVTNLYSTGLISWKIWNTTKNASAASGNNLRHFLSILVESAGISTTWATFYIVTHQINSDIQFVALIPLPAVAGIANALIQARIGMGKTVERTAPSSYPISSSVLHSTRGGGADTLVGRSDTFVKPEPF